MLPLQRQQQPRLGHRRSVGLHPRVAQPGGERPPGGGRRRAVGQRHDARVRRRRGSAARPCGGPGQCDDEAQAGGEQALCVGTGGAVDRLRFARCGGAQRGGESGLQRRAINKEQLPGGGARKKGGEGPAAVLLQLQYQRLNAHAQNRASSAS